ncbi:APC family permease [Micromonospora sp. HUAS LYJ1]|uniref:APC family permease n=1 Tax=Micromonospora sp. HUAS LYJ1 TaxID=3061626 RepID=UPI0026718DD4|nr:APC family permease [Micromonospora sp. HUAS LYJ1]WKU03494.1 APC family permease [Micromonospora sp. HUAS LYJ1]
MSGGIGTARGVVLSVGAVLGPGVLVLPAIAVRVAGPASLVAWAALLCVSALIATSFAALGARYPDAGGVAAFTRRAFGARAAAVVGCWLYTAVPAGVVAGSIAGARYTTAALGAPSAVTGVTAAVLLGVVYAANLVGLRLSARLQLGLTGVLIAILVAVLTVAGPHVDPHRITPFAPHGVAGVGSAVAVLFVAICGWEATANLSAEFTHPTQVRRAAIASLTIVAVLYTGLAVCTVGVLGDDAGDTTVPLMRLLAPADHTWAATIIAAAAVLFTVAASITFVAASARAGMSLAHHHILPTILAVTGHDAEPRRHVLVQATAATAIAGAAAAAPHTITVETLMRVFAAMLACVTLAGLAAAARLLPRPRQRAGAAVAALAVTVVATLSTAFLLAPAVVAVVVLARRRPAPPTTDPPSSAGNGARPDIRDGTHVDPVTALGGIR